MRREKNEIEIGSRPITDAEMQPRCRWYTHILSHFLSFYNEIVTVNSYLCLLNVHCIRFSLCFLFADGWLSRTNTVPSSEGTNKTELRFTFWLFFVNFNDSLWSTNHIQFNNVQWSPMWTHLIHAENGSHNCSSSNRSLHLIWRSGAVFLFVERKAKWKHTNVGEINAQVVDVYAFNSNADNIIYRPFRFVFVSFCFFCCALFYSEWMG